MGQTSVALNASGQATASITLYDAQSTTLTVTSVTAPAGKTGVSGSFTVSAGALDHFAFALASPQTDGVAFTGTNTLTAKDVGRQHDHGLQRGEQQRDRRGRLAA